ncbi:MAG: circularly permuted type 2 ATP-grasp protein [Acidimicrobiia bacterium]
MGDPQPPTSIWDGYRSASGFHDELIGADRSPRKLADRLAAYLDGLGLTELARRQAAADDEIRALGITFALYDEDLGYGTERTWPFDVIPRLIDAAEWQHTEAGLIQRVAALNHFVADVYGERRMVAAGRFPAELLADSANLRPPCVGVEPAHDVWAHICGSDLVRDADGQFLVLEDNLRVPSGVSYVLENRAVVKRVFPELFRHHSIEPVDGYVHRLHEMLSSLAPWCDDPCVVVLTPGVYNSAYYEHVFLATQLGVELVESGDLLVADDDRCYMRTIDGPRRVDVIYRRVDDLFLDPEAFRPDSVIGVPGLMRAWRAGNVAIANAPGAGVADDKAVYAYVPEMIRYYLGEEPILPNVPTFVCHDEVQRAHVLVHLSELVVKPANEAGGYGLLIGPQASEAELALCAEAITADPRNWIAQPLIALSTAPTLVDGRVEPRHVDLRPFILSGETGYVSHGGLTRVALREGSYVVNSSQGGGSKDTWIVEV